ncbi:HutD/Ves family protein [Variovorax sp. LT1R16]|uniref:HutD/Ves family protein n=1 Tax=Variovorax sp. LT1R16 TaxID=3443728 RepID=UPI003F47B25A
MRRFALDALPVAPWRNGGGETREIDQGCLGRAPAEAAGPDGWDWRLSVASIAGDGAFSTFAGVDRTAVLVDGAVTLRSDTQVLSWTTAGDLQTFAGETAFSARLAQRPARFFNVMTRRANAHAEVVVHRADVSIAPSAGVPLCLLVLQGGFQVVTPSDLQPLDADQGLLASPHEAVQVARLGPAGCIVAVRVHPS